MAPKLHALKFAVVDIEATGGKADRTRLMEIAVYVVENGEITDRFSSLVNPGKNPDPYVQRLTGITPKMLRKAPKFEQVAARILKILQGTVFTAHDAPFDYSLLQREYARLGYDFRMPYLCTIELAKKLIPGLSSYGLENLVKNLRIPLGNRHRAFGDALATVHVLNVLLQKDPDLRITRSLIRNDAPQPEQTPSHRVDWLLHRLDGRPALLTFRDHDGHILYAGYARHPHLTAQRILARKPALMKQTRKVDTRPVPGKLIGRILARQINLKYRPPFSPPARKISEKLPFPLSDALLFDRGRFPYEQSVFLISGGRLQGYAYIDLNWQTGDLSSLEKRLTPLRDCPYGHNLVARHWTGGKFLKILPLRETSAD